VTTQLLDRPTQAPVAKKPSTPSTRRPKGNRVFGPRQGRVSRIVTHAVLIPLCLIWIYPFIWMISASLKPNGLVFSGLGIFPTQPDWGNYADAWVKAGIGQFFINSAVVAVSSVLIVVFATSMMGYALGRKSFPGKKVIIGVLAALAILPQGYTIIPIFHLITVLHLNTSLLGMILPQAGAAHIIQLLLYTGYFAQLPGSLDEAAQIDGAGYFRIFWRIYFPLALPVTATVIILQFIASWNDFLLPLVITLSQPNLQTLAVGVYSFQGQNLTNYSDLAAASTITLVPVIVVFLFLQRYFISGIAGAVKQ
jgi:ABC-type glycerol-3-phosphate transport system permease component